MTNSVSAFVGVLFYRNENRSRWAGGVCVARCLFFEAHLWGFFPPVLLSLNRLFIYLFFFFAISYPETWRDIHTRANDAMKSSCSSSYFYFRRWERGNVIKLTRSRTDLFPAAVVAQRFSKRDRKALERTLPVWCLLNIDFSYFCLRASEGRFLQNLKWFHTFFINAFFSFVFGDGDVTRKQSSAWRGEKMLRTHSSRSIVETFQSTHNPDMTQQQHSSWHSRKK